ncbi:type IV secretion system protein [Anaerobiospirillum sp. NML120448]|uniref:type IV secretion system protein n=1 Tax=Anaerobiospirillum sp. NML120448 TaxID=2932816 RepID=UPI001FF474AF|nr:type IV secretion system protein [Anaerobiospirillum sp. NML120448]MCK0513946.1 type IV secretion system protein [Anaerobiospirillum sp. NML120448]
MLTKPNQSKASTCFDEVPLISIDYFKYDYQDCTLSLTATFNQATQDQAQAHDQPEQQQQPQSQAQQLQQQQLPQLQQELPLRQQQLPKLKLRQQPLQKQLLLPKQPAESEQHEQHASVQAQDIVRAKDMALAKARARAQVPDSAQALAQAIAQVQKVTKQHNAKRTTKGAARGLKNLTLQDLAEGKKAPLALPSTRHAQVVLPIGRHLERLQKLDVANEPLAMQTFKATYQQDTEDLGRHLFKSLGTEATFVSSQNLGPAPACDVIITDAYAKAKAQEQLDLLGQYLKVGAHDTATAQHFTTIKDKIQAKSQHYNELNIKLKLDSRSKQQLSIYLDSPNTEPNYSLDPALDLWCKKFLFTINYKDVYMKCLNSSHHHGSYQGQDLDLMESSDQGYSQAKSQGRTPNHSKGKKERELNSSNSNHIPFALNSTQKRNIELSAFKGSISNTAILFISLGFAFLSLAAFISRSMDTTVVPYVVTVDTHGVVRAQGTIDEKTDYMKSVPEQVISSQLCNFISDMRMVTPDKNMQKKALSHVFSCLKRDSKVFNQLQSTFEKSNPLDPQDKQEVQVEIANVIPLDHYTYQIDWLEKRTNSDDLYSHNQKMRALVSYEITAGYYQDPNLLMLNPLNLFIKELVVTPIIA